MRAPGRSLKQAIALSAVAAVTGNAFVGRDSLAWFQSLRRPRGMVPMPAFYAVGGLYYAAMTTVTKRALDRGDRRALGWAAAVLVGNEAWNYAFFGRRSPGLGLAGTVVFLVPLGALRSAVADDPVSARLIEIYGAWVAYDLYWAHGLWRLNPN
jgi:benzodiazapine receptor